MGNINKHTVTQTHFIQNGQKRRKKKTASKKRSRSRSTKRVTKKKAAPKKRKAKKAKRTPKVGKKWQVWKGTRERTAGGLRKKDLRKSKSGKIVSKKQSDLAKKRMKKGGISKWLKAV